MTKEQIFEVVKANVMNVLPDLLPSQITTSTSLVDLGANSVDRVEVSIYSMEALDLKIPRVQLHGVQNLGELVDVFHRHLNN